MGTFNWIPTFARQRLRIVRNRLRHSIRKYQIKTAVDYLGRSKIVVGSDGTKYDGWVSTEQEELDLLCENNWSEYFEGGSLDAILAEHVWEHLTPLEANVAASTCFKFLKAGGYVRVAVPDGYHPNPHYISAVEPGGGGWGAEDHKVLYTHDSLSQVFKAVGFEVKLLEYHDQKGRFYQHDWEEVDGFIKRSARFDRRNINNELIYTSIIIDAKKP